MISLYKVRTSDFRTTLLVYANGYDEAVFKAEQEILNTDTQNILDHEGSLRGDYKPVEIETVEKIRDKIIR